VHLRPLGAAEPDPLRPGDPRVDYDAPHRKAWGTDLVIYLLTKGISTGAMMLSAVLWLLGDRSPLVGVGGPILSVVFAMATAVVLVLDLERPDRFYYILTRPNWTSWLARGAFLLTGHSGLATLWVVFYWMGWTTALTYLAPFAILLAFGATIYTGFLFAQGLARDLWQGPHATVDLFVQSIAEGAAGILVVAVITGADVTTLRSLGLTLAVASFVHFLLLALEHLLTPSPTVHHELATRAIRQGVFKNLFWIGALGMGGLAPLAMVGLASVVDFSLLVLVPTALVALAGSLAWEYIWVEAGQAVPNS
jgi:formate-dependent nitrite reductase membrane component NrfD